MQHIKHYSLGLLVVLALLLGALISAQPALAMTGEGTSANPYEIATADDLRAFASLVNGTDNKTAQPNAWAVLAADIDLNPGASYDPTTDQWTDKDGSAVEEGSLNEWTPIGSFNNTFTGTFDGNEKTISGLYINSTDRNETTGLFGYVGSGGKVTRLTVEGAVTVSADVGGVVGNNKGTVSDCINKVKVTASGNSALIGGVVGINNGGTVSGCTNTGTVTATGSNAVAGGVMGVNLNTVNSCYNTGAVTGTTAGGVVGANSYGSTSGTVNGCYFLVGTAASGVGDNSGTITNVGSKTFTQFNSGEVT